MEGRQRGGERDAMKKALPARRSGMRARMILRAVSRDFFCAPYGSSTCRSDGAQIVRRKLPARAEVMVAGVHQY
jgi:hypothetical protein